MKFAQFLQFWAINFAFYEHFCTKNAIFPKLQKLSKFQIALKFDLMVLHKCHRYENTSKESQEHIFDNIYRSGHFRPIPATNQICKIKKIIKKSPKMRFFKNPYFVIKWPEIWYLAGNGSFGPQKAPRKPILNILHNLAIFSEKQKKSHFWSSKSM